MPKPLLKPSQSMGMSKKYLLAFLLLIHGLALPTSSFAQITLSLQPGPNEGKDAYLRDLTPNENLGSHPDFLAHAWTYFGEPVTVRSLIEFDLSGLEPGTLIDGATLRLYSYDSPGNGSHSTLDGSNECTISRITSAWLENEVTWNDQPSTTDQNQLILSESTSPIQDYTLDVTTLVQDMVDDPENSHGFFFKLVTEELYRRMLFASSDNQDSELRPELEIKYFPPTSLNENMSSHSEWTLFPIPAKSLLNLEFRNLNSLSGIIYIYSASGQLVDTRKVSDTIMSIDVSNFDRGLYLARFSHGEAVLTKRFIID